MPSSGQRLQLLLLELTAQRHGVHKHKYQGRIPASSFWHSLNASEVIPQPRATGSTFLIACQDRGKSLPAFAPECNNSSLPITKQWTLKHATVTASLSIRSIVSPDIRTTHFNFTNKPRTQFIAPVAGQPSLVDVQREK